jgi:ADP-ribosyl-[dinitrogen reductase] hydrolase
MRGATQFLILSTLMDRIFGFRMMMSAATAAPSTAAAAGASLSLNEKKRAAMFGLYVGDAVAMPVHWMYNLGQLQSDYGKISGYVRPKDSFYGSIMNLSNTGGGGRGSDQGSIVGDVILHGKKKYWMRGGNFHYHMGLQAGENTLEAQLVRVLSKSIAERGAFDANDFRERYIKFMTTPGETNDTYASTCHRMFFANLVRGVPPADCADNDGHNTDAIDALTLTVPVILKYADAPVAERLQRVKEVIYVTRRTRALDRYAEAFSELMVAVLHGGDLRTEVEKCGMRLDGGDQDGLIRYECTSPMT